MQTLSTDINQTKTPFEQCKKTREDGSEYWSARDLYSLMGYARYESFKVAITRAMISAKTIGEPVDSHFRGATQMVSIGNTSASKERSDVELSRYACYLVAQNGDPRIPQIATAQLYFAVQTRKQEVREEIEGDLKRIEARKKLTATEKKFAGVLYNRNVSGKGIQAIRARGDKQLFNKTTEEMKKQYGIVDPKKPLADLLPTVSIKAKDLATEMTTVNTETKNIRGNEPIAREHEANNAVVRRTLINRGIYPEKLPPAEDVKMLERKFKKDQKKLAKTTNEKPLKIKGDFEDALDKVVKSGD